MLADKDTTMCIRNLESVKLIYKKKNKTSNFLLIYKKPLIKTNLVVKGEEWEEERHDLVPKAC